MARLLAVKKTSSWPGTRPSSMGSSATSRRRRPDILFLWHTFARACWSTCSGWSRSTCVVHVHVHGVHVLQFRNDLEENGPELQAEQALRKGRRVHVHLESLRLVGLRHRQRGDSTQQGNFTAISTKLLVMSVFAPLRLPRLSWGSARLWWRRWRKKRWRRRAGR